MGRTVSVVALVMVALGSIVGGGLAGKLLGARPAAAQPDAMTVGVLTARELRLVDANGALRANIRTEQSGQVTVTLREPASNGTVVLGLADGVPWLRLRAGDGRTTELYIGSSHQLVLADPAGEYLAQFGTGVLRFRDDQHRIRLSLGLFEDGSPQVSLRDPSRVRAAFGLFPDGLPSLELKDGNGTVIWAAP